jgi:hypothetical protein
MKTRLLIFLFLGNLFAISAQKMAPIVSLPNGWKLSSAGKSFGLGDLPLNIAVSNSKKFVAHPRIGTIGNHRFDIRS